ncbi:histidinol-phosphate/aromatic aminotransferase/cobyric acid decarboxylase-like protein/choline kinase [Dysgonomonadaceae bacterium PH5-43]|nr:histidinol-phosphate/aromatic aminotransferase/cobyric acid decarboxylase-like protein/choline kinase [Dysgonomonadaceae bacterium PH5-43]
MQALILAAGMGKRLGELTNNNTKCMVKVNNVTLIERVLKQIETRNFEQIVIVTGYQEDNLKEYIKTLNISTPIVYVSNPIYDTTNNIYSLYLARDYMSKNDTILFESDLIFEDAVLDKIMNNPYPNLALVSKFENWMDGTSVVLDKDDKINRFISEKDFVHEDSSEYYKTVNIYKFSKEFSNTHYIPFLEAYLKALGNNEYYEQVLKVIAYLDKPELKALRLEGEKWYEIDDVQDLDIAESVFACKEERLSKLEKRYGGYWRYESIIDFCYLVNPYFPDYKLSSELKANFDSLLREYPSGMSVNSLLAAKMFNVKQKYSLIGNGAAELIKILLETLDGKFGIVFPTFEEYPNRLKEEQLEIYNTSNENFAYTAKSIINYFDKKSIDTFLLINPDNPSGNFIPYNDLLLLCKWSKQKQIRLIVDESFVDFSDESINNSLIDNSILEEYSNLIVIKSISKSYGVPGLRLGVMFCSDEILITSVKKALSIWNINSFAEFFMQIIGKYNKRYQKGCQAIAKERCRFHKELEKIPFLRPIPSQANYILCEVLNPYTSKFLAIELLSKADILIKDCSGKKAFNNKEYIRLAVRNEQDNNKLLETLRKF